MIVLNGQPASLPAGATVLAALERLGISGMDTRGVAVAVDGEVVPRGTWTSMVLPDGARVEIVRATQGG